MKICAKNDFSTGTFFLPSDLDLSALELKFAHLVTLVQGHIYTKLEVSISFLFREN